jgi:hypothetical protein
MTFSAKTFKTLVALLDTFDKDGFCVYHDKNEDGAPILKIGIVDLAHIYMGEFTIPTLCEGLNSGTFNQALYVEMETARIVAAQAVAGTSVAMSCRRTELGLSKEYKTVFEVSRKHQENPVSIEDFWSEVERSLDIRPRKPTLDMTDAWTFPIEDLLPLYRRGRFLSGSDTMRLEPGPDEGVGGLTITYGEPSKLKFIVGSEYARLSDKHNLEFVQFDYNFFGKITTAIRRAGKKTAVTLSCATSYPVKLTGRVNDVSFEYYIAPRVDDVTVEGKTR